MQVKITKIFRTDKDKEGNPLVGKNGKPYSKCNIKTDRAEFGDKYLSGWGNEINATWKEGDIVDIQVERNGEYLNYTPIKPFEEVEEILVEKGIQKQASQTTTSTRPQLSPNWDAIAEGKVRHGVACEFIRLGKPLTKDTIESIDNWTKFIMTGKLTTKEEQEIDQFLEDYNG